MKVIKLYKNNKQLIKKNYYLTINIPIKNNKFPYISRIYKK